LQSLQAIGPEASVAVLRVTGGFLDSRFGQSRSEASQLSQMLGLSLPHGIVACALRGLLAQRPEPERLEEHHQVLLAALDLFQITTVNNHQTTAQLGHAGMLHAMLELLEKTEVASLTVVTWMLRGLELVSEVSGTAALVLFRDFGGLQAFSVRLQREVALILALDSAETVVESDPPRDDAAEEEKQRFRRLFEEVTLRRRLCRQLLKNIQTALQCSEVLQGLAGIFQGQLTDALKLAVKAPMKMGLQLFGTAIDIVSSFIQDDPSRVPQMIESEVLPEIMGALNKDTLRSVESLNFVPGLLSSIALHSVGENFILSWPNKPVQLLTEAFIDVSYAGMMHTQPELVQVMGTQVEKVLRNRPAGPTKLTEHVVDCMLDTMRQVADQAKAYPDWTPLDLEDHTDFLPDRLAPLCRFCWSILSTNEAALKCFLERKGLSVVRELQELSCGQLRRISVPFDAFCSNIISVDSIRSAFSPNLSGRRMLNSVRDSQQHPMASLFTLQVKGSEGNLAAAAELKEMLNTHLEKVVPTLQEMAAGDPAAAIASMGSAEVVTFLRTLSRATAALESMLSVCRECSSTQVLEAVREPLRDIAPLAGCTFVLAAWHSQERERLPATASYHETVRAVFAAEKSKEGLSEKDAAETAMEATSDGREDQEGEVRVISTEKRSFEQAFPTASEWRVVAEPPSLQEGRRILFWARMMTHGPNRAFGHLMSSTLRKTLFEGAGKVLLSATARQKRFQALKLWAVKRSQRVTWMWALAVLWHVTLRQLLQLATKLHSRQRASPAPGLARQLAQVARSILLAQRPENTAAALRWVGEVFDVLQKMHEEQNKVALWVADFSLAAVRPLALCTFYQAGGFDLLPPLIRFVADELGGPHAQIAGASLTTAASYFEKLTAWKRYTHAMQIRPEDGLMLKEQLCHSIQAAAVKSLLPIWQSPRSFSNYPRSVCSSMLKVWLQMAQNEQLAVYGDERMMRPFRGKGVGPENGAAPRPNPERTSPANAQGDAEHVQGTLVDMGFTKAQVASALNHFGPRGSEDIGQLIMWIVANPLNAEASENSGAPEVKEIKEIRNQVMEDLLPRIFACGYDVPKALPAVVDTICALSEIAEPIWPNVPPDEAKEEEEEEEERAGSSDENLERLSEGQIREMREQYPKMKKRKYKDKGKSKFKDKKKGMMIDSGAKGNTAEDYGSEKEQNLKVIIFRCLDELQSSDQVPSEEKMSCVTQVLANLLHRRPNACRILGERKGKNGEHGLKHLLQEIHDWCVAGIDFTKSPEERGHRLIHCTGRAPAPPGVGDALLPAPAWFTPAVVCAQQLLCKAELVKYGDGTQVLDTEIQQMWVTLALDILYAFPGLDGALAQSCLQVLIRLCGTTVGSKALLSYQLSPRFAVTEGPETGVRAVQLLLRLGKQANFQGLFQMLAEFLLLLLEDGPALQQRMENEILQSFGARREMPARDLCRMNYHLLSRNPHLFEEALRTVTQKSRDDIGLTIEPIPEAERPMRQRMRFGALPPALPILQTLVNELCFGVDVGCRTSFQKLYEAATKEDKASEEPVAPPEGLPPPYPLALGPISILCVMDTLLGRSQGLSSMLLKAPLPVPALETHTVEERGSLVIASSVPSQKSLLLLMMRHLLPQVAQLSELWPRQMSLLKPAQKSSLSTTANPVQRLLPHLAAVLCSLSRYPGEPRRALVAEAVVALRSLAEGPKSAEEEGEYGAQVATTSTILARLLSAVPANERKEDKDAAGTDATTQDPNNASPRLNALDHPSGSLDGLDAEFAIRIRGSNAAAPPAKKARTRKDSGHFTTASDMNALREAFAAVLQNLPLRRTESTLVAGSVVRRGSHGPWMVYL
ncbi:unnamed protein product, partial [Cladocopium goreaui]